MLKTSNAYRLSCDSCMFVFLGQRGFYNGPFVFGAPLGGFEISSDRVTALVQDFGNSTTTGTLFLVNSSFYFLFVCIEQLPKVI